MPLSFRQRIFLVLAALTAVPTVVAVIGWAVAVRADAPSAGARVSLEQLAVSARQMLEHVDTLRLAPDERAAMHRHLAEISSSVTLARRAETYLRYYTGGFVAVVLALGALVLFTAVRVAGHLSRQLSRPIDELVGWTRLIRRRLPLPAGVPSRGAPEFDALRQALRELVAAIEAAREHELESERLRAFREVARRVAHEIKNPLTSIRIAVDQLGRAGGQAGERTAMAIEVLGAETDRLDHLAREFADFGRLPEGAPSEVDLVELLEELGRSAVPDGVRVIVHGNGGRRALLGHYDPLRRAFSNLFRNASEAMDGQGQIDVGVAGADATAGGGLVVTVADHGAGIPEAFRHRVFEPYFTTKTDGTGLGLALVRQTLEAHGATIRAEETPGGGATFTIVFPG
jgi:signal transduction histidine kinase